MIGRGRSLFGGLALLAGMAAAPDGFAQDEAEWIVFVSGRSGNSDLFALPVRGADETEPVRLTDSPLADGDPRRDAANGRLVHMRYEADGAGTLIAWPDEALGPSPAPDGAPVYAPAGESIAWHGPDGDSGDRIFLAETAQARPERLTESDRMERYPAFSPDGLSLAFARREAAGWVIMESRLADGEERRLFGPEAYLGHLAYSPDGRKLAFDMAVDGETDIALIALDDPDSLELIARPGMDFAPAWTGEGGPVFSGAILERESVNLELFLARPGEDPTRLTESPGFDGGAVILPSSLIGQE